MRSEYDRPALQGHKGGVTRKQQELLVRLMEECAELTMACSKILRWGWKSFNPDDPGAGSNEQQFHREAADVAELYDRVSRLRQPARPKRSRTAHTEGGRTNG